MAVVFMGLSLSERISAPTPIFLFCRSGSKPGDESVAFGIRRGGSLQISRLRKVPGCIITEPVVELTQWIDIGTRDRPRSAPAESKLALVPIRPTCGSADTKSARCWARAEWARFIGLT